MKKRIMGKISIYGLQGPVDDVIKFLREFKEKWGDFEITEINCYTYYEIEVEVKPR